MRDFTKEQSDETKVRSNYDTNGSNVSAKFGSLSIAPKAQPSNQDRHEKLLDLTQLKGLPLESQAILDHVMLLRAKEKYLFDCQLNQRVISDDPWLRDIWAWIGGE